MVSVKQRWNPIVNLPKTPKAFSGSLECGPAKPNKEKEVRNLMLSCYEMYKMYFSLSGIKLQKWTFKRKTENSGSTTAWNHHCKHKGLEAKAVWSFDIIIQQPACWASEPIVLPAVHNSAFLCSKNAKMPRATNCLTESQGNFIGYDR